MSPLRIYFIGVYLRLQDRMMLRERNLSNMFIIDFRIDYCTLIVLSLIAIFKTFICGLHNWYPDRSSGYIFSQYSSNQSIVTWGSNNGHNSQQIVTPIFDCTNSMSWWKKNFPIFSWTSMNCKNRSIKLKIFVDTVLESWRFILSNENIFGYHYGTPQCKIFI